MNNLLPELDELTPITDNKNTFYDCDFNLPFNELPFEKKLQIVNDLVRQTIMPTSRPNPNDHTDTLIGNCHTAALVSISYLKHLNLGKNYRYVMGRIKQDELDDFTTTHALVLVDDENNNTYQFDATPYVGYYYGSVVKISKERIYLEYVTINDSELELLDKIKEFMILDNEGLLTLNHLEYYKKILFECINYPILNGYCSHCFKLLSKYTNNKYEYDKCIETAILLNPYDVINKKNDIIRMECIGKRIKKWQDELNDIINDSNLKRQLFLAQNIVQEMKFIDDSYERYLNLNGKQVRLSHITPRLLREEMLNTVMIKPSSYFFNQENYIREKMVSNSNGPIGKYQINLSKKTEITNIKPMLFSHPCGEEYIRSMNGTSEVFLIKKDATTLYNIKKSLRKELGEDYYGKEIIWSDNEPILWHPFVTNYVHSADNYSESSLHYLIGFPEHQLMTRFMYPNKKLERKL